MRRSRLSYEEIGEIIDQIEKLKEYEDLYDSSIIDNISMNAKLLRFEAQHDPHTGVPSPKDQSLQEINTSFESSVFSEDNENTFSSYKLEIIKQENQNMFFKLREALKEFREANQVFLEIEEKALTKTKLTTVTDLENQINFLGIRLLESETKILHKDEEKLFLEEKIEEMMRENFYERSNCKCQLFEVIENFSVL